MVDNGIRSLGGVILDNGGLVHDRHPAPALKKSPDDSVGVRVLVLEGFTVDRHELERAGLHQISKVRLLRYCSPSAPQVSTIFVRKVSGEVLVRPVIVGILRCDDESPVYKALLKKYPDIIHGDLGLTSPHLHEISERWTVPAAKKGLPLMIKRGRFECVLACQWNSRAV